MTFTKLARTHPNEPGKRAEQLPISTAGGDVSEAAALEDEELFLEPHERNLRALRRAMATHERKRNQH
jgi:hypothetical protein